MTIDHRIHDLDQLRQIYRQPSELTINKERPTIDESSRQFLEHCRFAVIGTLDADGNPDASPRGGESGFVRVLDEQHLAMADLGGNPEAWAELAGTPDGAAIFSAQQVADATPEQVRSWLPEGYDRDLALER